jgi:hypothetical protein
MEKNLDFEDARSSKIELARAQGTKGRRQKLEAFLFSSLCIRGSYSSLTVIGEGTAL